MHRAFVGDFQQPLALLGVERAFQRNVAVDAVEHALLGFAAGATQARKIHRLGSLSDLSDRSQMDRSGARGGLSDAQLGGVAGSATARRSASEQRSGANVGALADGFEGARAGPEGEF